MARPRKPKKILELTGAFRKNPKRKREREQEPTAPPLSADSPSYFNDDEHSAWRDIMVACCPGVLLQSDAILLELAARLLAQFRADPDMPAARIGILSQCLSRMGLSPSDRSKVTVPAPEPEMDDEEKTLRLILRHDDKKKPKK